LAFVDSFASNVERRDIVEGPEEGLRHSASTRFPEQLLMSVVLVEAYKAMEARSSDGAQAAAVAFHAVMHQGALLCTAGRLAVRAAVGVSLLRLSHRYACRSIRLVFRDTERAGPKRKRSVLHGPAPSSGRPVTVE